VSRDVARRRTSRVLTRKERAIVSFGDDDDDAVPYLNARASVKK